MKSHWIVGLGVSSAVLLGTVGLLEWVRKERRRDEARAEELAEIKSRRIELDRILREKPTAYRPEPQGEDPSKRKAELQEFEELVRIRREEAAAAKKAEAARPVDLACSNSQELLHALTTLLGLEQHQVEKMANLLERLADSRAASEREIGSVGSNPERDAALQDCFAEFILSARGILTETQRPLFERWLQHVPAVPLPR